MNVASLELCKELFELSGWGDTYWCWQNDQISNLLPAEKFKGMGLGYTGLPAYELGYLLRKLPAYLNEDGHREYLYLGRALDGNWLSAYQWLGGDSGEKDLYQYNQDTDTPEDAAAKLAIELWKSGVLS